MERVRPVGRPQVRAYALALPTGRKALSYAGKELGEARKDLHITSAEFDEIGAEFGRALDELNVPEREKQEVMAAIVARNDEVVHQSR